MSPLLHPQGKEHLPIGEIMNHAPAIEGSTTDMARIDKADTEDVEVDGILYRKHRLGGGLVAHTATVGPRVYVAPRAMIRGRSVVLDAVRLFDEAIVEESAIVVGCCTLHNSASIGGEAVLRGSVSLADRARVDGIARLSGSLKLKYFAHVSSGNIGGGITIS